MSARKTSPSSTSKAQFVRISSAGLRESHVHDVTITRESPNYPSRVLSVARRQASFVLASRPVGEPKPTDFRLEEFPVPQPGAGQMLLRTKWLSLDPYMRGRMSDAPSYAKPVGIDEVMEGGTVSEVARVQQRQALPPGDIVLAPHRLADPRGLRRRGPAQARSGARAGLDRARRARHAGHDRLYGPARDRPAEGGRDRRGVGGLGAVGSVVGQIARIKGARAVGIAGGPDKCSYVTDELGFDDCVDHRAPRSRRAAQGRVPERHRRLFRECRRRRCSRRCFRCSIRSRACRCAA